MLVIALPLTLFFSTFPFASLHFLPGTQLVLHGVACTCFDTHFMSSNDDLYTHTLICANVDLAPFGVTFLAS